MLGAMEKLIHQLHLLPSGCTVLCAVSGGADSVCLLHALYHLRPQLGFHLAAGHYNHMLRDAESDGDALFVAQFVKQCCGEQRLPDGTVLPPVTLFSGVGDVAAQAALHGGGIEQTARDMRYAFLRQAAQQAGADRIATAHHADDNAETILFHLARGSGLRGLTGIQPVRDDLIRPLLTTTRHETEEYLAHHGLPHREDRTNLDDAYTRNRIRHQVVPVLQELCPGFVQRLADTATMLRQDEDYLAQQAGAVTAQTQMIDGGVSISAALLAQAPRPLAIRAVRQLLGRAADGVQDYAANHLEVVLQLCTHPSPSARAHLPHGITARREYDSLILTQGELPPPLPLVSTPLPLPGQAHAGDWLVVCTAQPYGGQPQTSYEFWLDSTLLPQLILRSRRTGDHLRLPGRPEKTVKKWHIDEKIPVRMRATLPILDCNGQLVAAAGLGPDQRFLPKVGDAAWHIHVRAASDVV